MPSLKATIDFLFTPPGLLPFIDRFMDQRFQFLTDKVPQRLSDMSLYRTLLGSYFVFVTVQLLMDKLKDPRMAITVGLGGNNQSIIEFNCAVLNHTCLVSHIQCI